MSDDATEAEVEAGALSPDGAADDGDAADLIRSDALFLKHAPTVLAELRCLVGRGEVDYPERPRFAGDQAVIAMCERLSRIARRDVG